ncbi:MAG: pentapeptide repeat-containing protein [Phormidesmis sp.]
MPPESDLLLKKPISVWNKPLKVNFKDFFKSLGKAGVDASTGQWIGLAKDAVDVLSAVGLESCQPTELSWALIYNALSRSVYTLVADAQFLIKESPINPEKFYKTLDQSLENRVFELKSGFFMHPEKSEIVRAMQQPLKQWLESVGVSSFQASTLSRRLPTYFVLALNHEWRSRPEYSAIVTYINTPFAEAKERLRGWQLYKAWLQKQIEEPMMFEAFGLADVYVPLRGYFRQLPIGKKSYTRLLDDNFRQAQKIERVVVDLEEELIRWLHKADKNDAIRVISGDPGSGKSSFAKIFAARLAQHKNFPVLFVPLHLLNPKGDLIEEIATFIRYDHYIKQNPLCPDDEDLRLLLILDGLDELSMQGKVSKECALEFVREVQTKVNLFNQRQTRLQVVITGREIAIQSAFQQTSNVLHVLPYCVNQLAIEQKTGEPFVDSRQALLRNDQRHDWWHKYGTVSQQAFTAMPSDLIGEALSEITAQPLLNYLVALSYTQGKLSVSKTVNLNAVYADLLEAVYERAYENNRKHTAVGGLSQSDFLRILEEIAMAAWHGQGRTTTVKEIEARCHNSGLMRILEIFQEGAIAGVTRLLTAFYFRQNGVRSDECTFEFTHKSFGEYLVAKRIVAALQKIQKQVERHQEDMEDGWNSREALLYWVKTCGPTRIDVYLLEFLINEVSLYPSKQVATWQKTLSNLIGVVLHKGLPVESIEPSLTFRLANQWAINSEESLLALLNACAKVTQSLSEINWPDSEAFGVWIGRLQEKRGADPNSSVALRSLGYLDLSDAVLDFIDLRYANFERACLTCASLVRASLDGVNFKGSTLDGAVLDGAYLTDGVLDGAGLTDASLEGANLDGASLNGTSLNWANLDRASVKGACLLNVHLDHASLKEANLEGASLDQAYLISANLDGATLNGASFVDARLDNARLDGTNCEGISLMGAVLKTANLAGADLSGARLLGASLDAASLGHARLERTTLLGASLEDTDLEMATCNGASLIEATLDRTNLKLANLQNIVWDEGTAWIDLRGISEAINIPELLKAQLRIC